jgi:hypothetical protein
MFQGVPDLLELPGVRFQGVLETGLVLEQVFAEPK